MGFNSAPGNGPKAPNSNERSEQETKGGAIEPESLESPVEPEEPTETESNLNLDALLGAIKEELETTEQESPAEEVGVSSEEVPYAEEDVEAPDKSQIEAKTREKEVQVEKERRALEGLKPKLDAFMELVNEQRIFDGKKIYHTLRGNFEGYAQNNIDDYTKSEIEKRKQQFAINALFDEMASEYEKQTGEPLYISGIPPEFRSEKYFYSDDTHQPLNGKTEAEYLASFEARDKQFPLAKQMKGPSYDQARIVGTGDWGFNNGARYIAKTPKDYVAGLEKLRSYRTSNKYNFGPGSAEFSDPENRVPERTKMIQSHGFDTEAQGIALAALESGDPDTAAKALAFAETVQPMSARTLQRVQQALSGLNSSQKRTFLTSFESEKKKSIA